MPKGQYKRTKYHLRKLREGIKKRRSFKGKENPSWKGGRSFKSDGYIRIRKPDHPFAADGYVLEHRLIVEKHIGRFLKVDEHIHHINKIKTDNRIENLKIVSNNEHRKYHNKYGEANPSWKGGKPKCSTCKITISYGKKHCKKHREYKRNEKGVFIKWHMDWIK